MDLNIENYSLIDILNLFDIPSDFNCADLKNVKRKALMTHPDKSNLDCDVFNFFVKAYKILKVIYAHRHQKSNTYEINNQYIAFKSSDLSKFDDATKDAIKFNNKFNKLFDEVNINDTQGYGEWLSSSEETKINRNDITSSILSIATPSNLTNISLSVPTSYSCDVFSKFGYEDVKIAHSSPCDIKDDSRINMYKNVSDLKKIRLEQNVQPFTMKQSEQILQNVGINSNLSYDSIAFELEKQVSKSLKSNQIFAGHFKYLK